MMVDLTPAEANTKGDEVCGRRLEGGVQKCEAYVVWNRTTCKDVLGMYSHFVEVQLKVPVVEAFL